MDRVILIMFAALSLFVGYVYLFKPDLAIKWDNSQRHFRGVERKSQDEAWRRRARHRGVSAFILAVFLLAIASGVL